MVEYLYNTIRCSKGSDNVFTAYITDEENNLITENCNFIICDGATDMVILVKEGSYDEQLGAWDFLLTTEEQKDFFGRYLYYIEHDGKAQGFRQPIYYV